jgi:hypothetical protein
VSPSAATPLTCLLTLAYPLPKSLKEQCQKMLLASPAAAAHRCGRSCALLEESPPNGDVRGGRCRRESWWFSRDQSHQSKCSAYRVNNALLIVVGLVRRRRVAETCCWSLESGRAKRRPCASARTGSSGWEHLRWRRAASPGLR